MPNAKLDIPIRYYIVYNTIRIICDIIEKFSFDHMCPFWDFNFLLFMNKKLSEREEKKRIISIKNRLNNTKIAKNSSNIKRKNKSRNDTII